MSAFPNGWPRVFAVLLVAAALSLAGAAQEKVKLAIKAEAGREARYSSDTNVSFEVMGQKMTMEVKQVERRTIKDVKPNGEITFDQQTESADYTMNGEKGPAPEEELKEVTTIVVRPDGTVVSMKSTKEQKDSDKVNNRLFMASHPIYPEQPVGLGDKWNHDYKADSDLGTENAHADFELVSFEKVNGVDTAQIKMTFKESSGGNPISGTNTFWVEKASGDMVKEEASFEGVKFGEGQMAAQATVKGHGERISGGIMAVAGQTTPGKTEPGKAAETKTEAKKDKTIDDTVKDYEKLPGLFTLYRKKESGRTTLYMEVKEDQLDKLLMLQATAGTGTSDRVVAGDPINDLVFKLVKVEDERIVLVTPNLSFRADPNSPMAKAVGRSFSDSYLDSYKIEARQPDRKSLLINISELFRGDFAEVSKAVSGGSSPMSALMGGGGGGYTMDREKTYIESLKAYPENISARTVYAFSKGGGGGGRASALSALAEETLPDDRSLEFRVDYSLFMLPETGYKPRLADPRVGFFTTEYQDFTKDRKFDQKVRYILRWNLEKKDPTAKLSPPKKPIEFWLDNAIPIEYRPAVREGILAWNKAFELAGIKDAIVVTQMPDNADWDHADMRHNVIRWVASTLGGYAVALFRPNPLTGEILNACVTVDANITKYNEFERSEAVAPSARALASRFGYGPQSCSIARDEMKEAAFGDLALTMLAPAGSLVDEKRYTYDFVRSIVMHEMGHIMGLRHNFIGSTELTIEQLKDPSVANAKGMSASIMDYVPFNISALKQKNTDYWQTEVGTYDKWAIQYGYEPIEATTPEGEEFRLKQIASQANQPGHAFETDENADRFDPLVTRQDLSANPLDYFQKKMEVSRYLLLNLDKRMPKVGHGYWEFARDYSLLLGTYVSSAESALRFVGGLHMTRTVKGDPGEKLPLVPIPGNQQKRALQMLNTYVLAENAFSIPKRYFMMLESNPNQSILDMIFGGGGASDFPVRNQFANFQRSMLRTLFEPDVLERVSNNEYKEAGTSEVLTLASLFRTVGDTVWSELGTSRPISPLRRDLQRSHLDIMVDMVVNTGNPAPADAKMLAWNELRKLRTRIMSVRSRARDEYTPIHLAETLMRINRALDAKQTLGAPAGRTPSMLERLLGGGN